MLKKPWLAALDQAFTANSWDLSATLGLGLGSTNLLNLRIGSVQAS